MATEQTVQRQSWASKFDFVVTSIGFAVGLGNVWRFPYLCYESGGGAFLIPFFITLILCGIPLFVMETIVGQYSREGPLRALDKICPLFRGTGFGIVIMVFLFCAYYNVILAWCLYYLYISLISIPTYLPWSFCGNTWNTPLCWDNYSTTPPNVSTTPSEEFFNNYVLERTDGIDDLGGMNWPLVACLAVAWAIVYLALFKGIKFTGKIVYFTALFPYIIFLTLLIWGCLLPGAATGITFFVDPQWNLLLDVQIWVNAAIQNFNSIGIAFGSLIAFASYNKFENRLIPDCIVVTVVNTMTSLISGFVVFSVLGYIAQKQGLPVSSVVDSGPGLVFIVYPAGLVELPGSQFFSIIFFFMLILIGIDSQFSTFETIVTTVEDAKGGWLQKKMRREFYVLLLVVFAFLCGLPLVTKGGIYVFELLNFYATGISLLFLALFECIAIVWFYGANTLSRNYETMTGRKPGIFFTICWWVVAPLLVFVMLLFVFIGYQDVTYGAYIYPQWSIIMGWMIACASIIPVPIVAIIVIYKSEGVTFFQKLKNSIKSPLKQQTIEDLLHLVNEKQTAKNVDEEKEKTDKIHMKL